MYEYATDNSKQVEDLERYCNRRAADGREFIQALACQDRYVCIFRRLRSK